MSTTPITIDEPAGSQSGKRAKDGYEHRQELNGVSAFVFQVRKGGQEITVSGWHPHHRKFQEGERILLVQKDGEETRYRIVKVQRPGDPPDQYFMECVFAPRSGGVR